MTVVPFKPRNDRDHLLRTAIAERRLLTFALNGHSRRAEPHDYGVIKGVTKLLFYQVGGRSTSGRPFGWRWAVVDEMHDVRLLDDHFDGPRDASAARHADWDALFASVSRPVF